MVCVSQSSPSCREVSRADRTICNVDLCEEPGGISGAHVYTAPSVREGAGFLSHILAKVHVRDDISLGIRRISLRCGTRTELICKSPTRRIPTVLRSQKSTRSCPPGALPVRRRAFSKLSGACAKAKSTIKGTPASQKSTVSRKSGADVWGPPRRSSRAVASCLVSIGVEPVLRSTETP